MRKTQRQKDLGGLVRERPLGLARVTSEQLQRALDLDLWRAPQPGLDNELDADRVVEWLEALIDGGAALALQTLAKMDERLVAAAIAQHVRVFDRATIEAGDNEAGCEIGGYVVRPKREDSWEVVAAFLHLIAAEGPDLCHRIMAGCRHLSNSRPEIDGLDNLLTRADQVMFDLAVAREERLERQGYATPADARAFLEMARNFPPRTAAPPAANPIVDAYFRTIGLARSADTNALAAARQPQALPVRSGSGTRFARLRTYMQHVSEIDQVVSLTRAAELAFLANTIGAGCSVQERPLTPQEASEGATATCNLGLENWPDHWRTGFDLIAAFQVGWTVLYEDVCMHAAERVLQVAAELPTRNHEVRTGLNTLRFELARHWRTGAPWRARDAMDVVLLLDQTVWAALVGLIHELPVLHAGLRARRTSASVDPGAFEFVGDNAQVAVIREFLRQLPERLGGV